jgi:DNA-binding ferritin-like protein
MENPDVDEIWMQAWESEESIQGNPSIGGAKWLFNGKGGSVTSEIAVSNIRKNYSIVYDIRENILEDIKENKDIDTSGLTEELKKEIHTKLADCEGKADREAERIYGWGCESCPEFIEVNVEKYAKKTNNLIEECIEKVRKEYNITEKTERNISTEALYERWALPPYPEKSSCCK